MITNPEYLSKDRLKQELKKRGVSFNPNENKDYYIQLFREKVMHGKELDKGRSELSSDEEFVRQSTRSVRKQQKKTPAKTKSTAAKINTFLPQVETLSDKDLTEQLQEYGENIGPITATTRSVYERKLAKLMATGGEVLQHEDGGRDQVDQGAPQESFIGEWSGDESDTTGEESAPPPSQRSHGRKHRDREDVVPPKVVKGVEEARPRQRHKPPSSSKPTRVYRPGPPPQAMSCSNVSSLICSVVLIVLMFTIAFLVYEHYTCAEDQKSLILTGWEKADEFVSHMRKMIIKEPLAEPVENADSTTKGSKSEGSAQPKKTKKTKKKKI